MIDHRIALGVQNPNILGEMARGTQLASAQNDLMRTAEQQNLFRQHGKGIMSGDPNALARLAQFDPGQALGVRTTLNEDRRADERLGMDRERIQMAREAVARSLMEAQDQAAAQREAAEFDTRAREAIGLLASGDEQAFMMAVSDLVGTAMPQSREDALGLLGMVYEGVKDYREATQQPSPVSTPGKVQADINAGFLPQGTPLQGGPLFDMSGAVIGGQQNASDFKIVDERRGVIAVADPSAPNGIRYENIPGGEADLEQRRARTDALEGVGKSEERDRQQNLKLGTTLTSIGLNIREIENGGVPVTGPIGALSARVPGTPAADFRNRTEQISTSAALSEVQNMRDNSPTGGAVGQLTDAEREAIGLSVTALNNSSSAQEYVRAARAYRELMLNIAHGEGNWTLNEANNEVSVRPTQQGPNPPRINSDQDYNSLPSGAMFIAPDGTMRRKP